MISCDKLKHQVRGQFLSRDKFILPRDVTSMSHRWLRYTMTAKQVNAAIDVFLVLRHAAPFFCIRRVYYKTLIPSKPMFYYILNIKMVYTIIIKLHRPTHLRLVALCKSLIMTVTSFICSKCNRTQAFMLNNQCRLTFSIIPYLIITKGSSNEHGTNNRRLR